MFITRWPKYCAFWVCPPNCIYKKIDVYRVSIYIYSQQLQPFFRNQYWWTAGWMDRQKYWPEDHSTIFILSKLLPKHFQAPLHKMVWNKKPRKCKSWFTINGYVWNAEKLIVQLIHNLNLMIFYTILLSLDKLKLIWKLKLCFNGEDIFFKCWQKEKINLARLNLSLRHAWPSCSYSMSCNSAFRSRQPFPSE